MTKSCPVSPSLRTVRWLALCLMALTAMQVRAQTDEKLHIFGTIQPIFFTQSWHLEGTSVPSDIAEISRNSFAVQQMDLFLAKQLDNEFDVFVDLEFQLNYSTQKRWGDFSIQEAWVNYGLSNQFNIKAGLLYPAFNHLNEIKNRLGILPYIFRPVVYERLLEYVFSPEQFIPERAFLEVHGTIPTELCLVDYAVYMGNSEGSYISRKTPEGIPTNTFGGDTEFLSGVDPTGWNLKLFGGRVGVRSRDEQSFKAGISFTHDFDNLRDSIIPAPLRGDAERFRLGLDARGSYADIVAELEYIHTFYHYQPFNDAGLKLENSFFTGMLGYNIREDLFAYVSYQHGTETLGTRLLFDAGYCGLTYRFNNAVSGKVQYITYLQRESLDGTEPWATSPMSSKLRINFFMVGCSVLF